MIQAPLSLAISFSVVISPLGFFGIVVMRAGGRHGAQKSTFWVFDVMDFDACESLKTVVIQTVKTYVIISHITPKLESK